MSSDQDLDEDSVIVPNLIGKTVGQAGPELSDIELIPALHDSSGNPILNPPPDWIVKVQEPPAQSEVPRGSTVVLRIAS
jgi:hypothetical protein